MFRATYDRVLAYVRRRADRADVEDIIAETYATAWRRRDIVPDDALPWLFGVARRTLANSRRSARRRLLLTGRLAGEAHSASTGAQDPVSQLEDTIMMRSALGSLREADREALMLVAWEGLDNDRASVVLGISPQAFAVRLHRARRRLQDEVQRLSARTLGDEDPEREA